MKQTSAPSASTVVKAAALLMAVPALLVPMKAAAQQMAAAGSPNLAACDAIQDPAKSAQCSHDTAMAILKQREKAAEARGADADVRLAALKAVAPCVDYLKAQKAAGRPMVRPVTKDNVCSVAAEMGMQPN